MAEQRDGDLFLFVAKANYEGFQSFEWYANKKVALRRCEWKDEREGNSFFFDCLDLFLLEDSSGTDLEIAEETPLPALLNEYSDGD